MVIVQQPRPSSSVTMSSTTSQLFQPIQVGDMQLRHRIVLPGLTRLKSGEKSHYYSQRASQYGTLLISEATLIARKAGLSPHAPGFYTQEQLDAWKEITDAVHAKRSFHFGQLWALGRAADIKCLREEDPSDPLPYVSASDVQLNGKEEAPRPLSIPEIEGYVALFAQAAINATQKAGFDGVEIHGANGYLIDQFLQDKTNRRPTTVVKAVGPTKTGIRLSPWNEFLEMRMDDPKPTYTYLVTQIKERFPNLAYIHVVEPRISGIFDRETFPEEWSNDFIREIWSPRPLITAGGYGRETAMEAADKTPGNLIAFGRHFIANPDLPYRLKKNLPLNAYNRATFFIPGDVSAGYTDYPFATDV
ncbi:NADH:flavin oxidoreductase/NADH oxidase [Mucidula mucida]|nr:NADH:flavin oxidoreductase/NADH oxidase [Mucidula mucida]